MSRILVLGGYGGFGARLSRRLAARGHTVLVAGRRRAAAEAFCASVPGTEPVVADRNGDLGPILAETQADLVIDAAGPFQGSGYGVPLACLSARIPYLDLADGKDFVLGIGALDAEAREAGVPVISGASSVPALSGAVVRRLADGMERVTRVEIAISASNRATAGTSVASAILAYAGRPVRVWRGGRWARAFGWQDLRRERIRLRGGPDLGPRWVALADVPDLALLPERVPGAPATMFRAGTEIALQTVGLWLASWPVRWGWLASLRPLAPWLLALQKLMRRLGSDRSGMTVALIGSTSGRPVLRRWTLVAQKGDGPEIPTLAAAILADRIAAGGIPPGARDAGESLDLAEFEADFATLAIRHGVEETPLPPPVYARVLGEAFARLPASVRRMHEVVGDAGATGRAEVKRGSNPLARLVAALMRFPAEGEHQIHVHFEENDGVETWTRDFSGRLFRSHLSERDGRLTERFGPFRFAFDLPTDESGLRMVMRGWSLFGIPLPPALAPRSEASEVERDGRFHFDVPIALPLIGLVVHYRGWLVPTGDAETAAAARG
ncbi:SDR family oxidoreductase [Enterovirga rhinocerotis]|uniref:Saccharopine dehydrogenase-like NADP-dependent oxidoreductase n=1 Tax=Enterovirga rhinocerotis TaxID=1339210 RepID=A0A4R7CAU1_9HYPH|nr:SDR family oxidoreductase [Enterovirga rhinocerotis]TDR94505.1 saccharopine dehydrogenase-like NADP-dependent oxidoreductase [Enterovirga rhinocerotis]